MPNAAPMSSPEPEASSARAYGMTALKLGVSGALLAYLLSQIDVTELWESARRASVVWLLAGLLVYFIVVVVSVWRWHLLLEAQGVEVRRWSLFRSILVALFFNNFLPSNIGGDVIRIRDTAKAAGSTTLAATVVLVDRGLGLMGLVLIAAVGATIAESSLHTATPIWPSWLWAGFFAGTAAAAPAVIAPVGFARLLHPLTVFHPEWVGGRIEKLTAVLSRFHDQPGALAGCFGGAVLVQILSVVFYVIVAYALQLNMTFWDLAVIVPVSFVVQMLPVSVNGLGLREATFTFYFLRLGVPRESALLVSLVPTALIMLFSLSGAAVYVSRRH